MRDIAFLSSRLDAPTHSREVVIAQGSVLSSTYYRTYVRSLIFGRVQARKGHSLPAGLLQLLGMESPPPSAPILLALGTRRKRFSILVAIGGGAAAREVLSGFSSDYD